MKMKNFAIAAVLGVTILFSGATQAMAAQWNCPYNQEDCSGQEYCEQHKDCVANDGCGHYNNNNNNNNSNHCGNRTRRSGHCR